MGAGCMSFTRLRLGFSSSSSVAMSKVTAGKLSASKHSVSS